MLTNQLQTIQAYINTLEDKVSAGAPQKTGNLKSSIKANYIKTQNGFELDVDGEVYGLFQDQGVNGIENNVGSPYTFSKMPPISAFAGYSSPYGMSRSIYKNGIKPKHFIEPSLNTIEEFSTDLSESMWEDYKLEDDKTKPKTKK